MGKAEGDVALRRAAEELPADGIKPTLKALAEALGWAYERTRVAAARRLTK